jgi:alpha-1,6-mannosyltransferase
MMYLKRIPPALWLAIVGAAMSAIFWVVYGGRYPLWQYGHLAFQSLGTLNQNSLESALLYIFSFGALFALYGLGAGLLRKSVEYGWAVLVGGAIVMNAVMLPMLPFDATDIYDYIIRGRMTAFYELNPMQAVPDQVPAGDSVYPFVSWRNANSAYGPAWEVAAGLTAKVAGLDRDTSVIAFKLLSCLGYALTTLFIALTLRTIAPERAQSGVLIFAWNPLMVYFAGGTGHNDMLMAACIALSVLCLVRRWYIPAILAVVLGALIKFIPLLMLPIIAIVIWKQQPLRRRFVTYAVGAVLSVLIVVAFYAPFWTGVDALAIDRRSRMFTSSAGTLARQALSAYMSEEQAGTIVNLVALGLFGLFYLSQLWVLFRAKEGASKETHLFPAQILLRVLLFYLLVSAIWFQHWYLAWIIPLAALLDDTPARRLVFWFSYLVTWQPLLYNYVTLRYDGWMPLPWRDLIPVSVFMGGAWLFVAGYWLSVWLRRGTTYHETARESSSTTNVMT